MRPPSSSYAKVSVRYSDKGHGTNYILPKISREKKDAIINIINEQHVMNKTEKKFQELQTSISSLETLQPFIKMIEYVASLYQQGKNVLSAINYINIVITTIIVLVLKYV